jgi:hypothetical protein
MKGQVTQLLATQQVQDQKIDGLVKLVQDLTSIGVKSTTSEAQAANCANSDGEKLFENILVLGGITHRHKPLNSAEMYSIKEGTWTSLEPMPHQRGIFTAHYYKGQVLVSGGYSDHGDRLDTIEFLQRKDGLLSWIKSVAEMPFEIDSHKTVIIDDHLMVFGGEDDGANSSKSIYKIQLFPPFSLTFECKIGRWLTYHCVESFGNDVLVFGGTIESRRVFLYNTVKKSCTPMMSLPIAMNGMATVKCEEDVLIFGGRSGRNTLNTVFKYNHKTSTCKQMPSMKYCRADFTAVLSRNKVYVMGGRGNNQGILCSMECFDLQRQVWEELAPMNEEKWGLAAVLLPHDF